MKQIFYLFILVSLSSCTKYDLGDCLEAKIRILNQYEYPTDTLMVTDEQGNDYVTVTMADNRRWMTENLKLELDSSWVAQSWIPNVEKFGRLYASEVAKNVCTTLGDNWRLPTGEEWNSLIAAYGCEDNAYNFLVRDSISGFNAQFGGSSSLDSTGFRRNEGLESTHSIHTYGAYWTYSFTEDKFEKFLFYKNRCSRRRTFFGGYKTTCDDYYRKRLVHSSVPDSKLTVDRVAYCVRCIQKV